METTMTLLHYKHETPWYVAHYIYYSCEFNPLPSLTLQSARNLNVPCRPKRSKALLLSCS